MVNNRSRRKKDTNQRNEKGVAILHERGQDRRPEIPRKKKKIQLLLPRGEGLHNIRKRRKTRKM